MTMGRPQEYTKERADELAETLAEMFRNGESLAEVCAEIGCCKETFYKMCDISEDFSYAYKKGLELSEAWWIKLGRAGSTGQAKIQPATWIFNMKNRFRWTDRNESTIEAGESFTEMLKQEAAKGHDLES